MWWPQVLRWRWTWAVTHWEWLRPWQAKVSKPHGKLTGSWYQNDLRLSHWKVSWFPTGLCSFSLQWIIKPACSMADVFQVGFDWKVLALYSNHSKSIIQYHNSARRWQPQIHTVLTNYDTNYIYTHTYTHTHKFHLEIWKKQRDRAIQKPLRKSTGEQENSLGQEQFTSLVSPCDILKNMAVSLSPATKKGFLDTWEINYLWALKKPMEKELIFQNTRPQQVNVAFFFFNLILF